MILLTSASVSVYFDNMLLMKKIWSHADMWLKQKRILKGVSDNCGYSLFLHRNPTHLLNSFLPSFPWSLANYFSFLF